MKDNRWFLAAAVLAVLMGSRDADALTPVKALRSYPSAGSKNVAAASTIGITYASQLDAARLTGDTVTVSGKRGRYSGKLSLSRDGKTLIFTPATAFDFSDVINVYAGTCATQSGAGTVPYKLSFTIVRGKTVPDTSVRSDDPILDRLLHKSHHLSKDANNNPLDLPQMNILANNSPYDGNMYMANFKFASVQSGTYLMVLDRNGTVITSAGGGPDYFNDFKPLPNGTFSCFDVLADEMFILDSNLFPLDSVKAANGYLTDGHEFRITPDGHYWILADDYETIDLSKSIPGADTAAVVLVPVIQEFDEDKNLVFEWKTIDHFQITDAMGEDIFGHSVDFCHSNAIEFDTDSNILLSNRHMDEITKIDRNTGEIIWRFGGKHNEFALLGDTLFFSHQHAIRLTPQGTYTLFDNGNDHGDGHIFSRALEFKLDQQNKIATEIWQFSHDPEVYSQAMGYVQRLPNGNTLIGWGADDNVSVTEVGPFNKTAFELVMDSGNYSYRVYKYDSTYVHNSVQESVAMTSVPQSSPVICSPNPLSDRATIYFSTVTSGAVRIEIFDELGKQAAVLFQGDVAAGSYTVPLDGHVLSNGVYHVRINVENAPTKDAQILVVK